MPDRTTLVDDDEIALLLMAGDKEGVRLLAREHGRRPLYLDTPPDGRLPGVEAVPVGLLHRVTRVSVPGGAGAEGALPRGPR